MRYWKFVDTKGKTTSVQSCSNDANVVKGAVEITQTEFDAFIASLPVVIPPPVRDLVAEIDDLKARINILETK